MSAYILSVMSKHFELKILNTYVSKPLIVPRDLFFHVLFARRGAKLTACRQAMQCLYDLTTYDLGFKGTEDTIKHFHKNLPLSDNLQYRGGDLLHATQELNENGRHYRQCDMNKAISVLVYDLLPLRPNNPIEDSREESTLLICSSFLIQCAKTVFYAEIDPLFLHSYKPRRLKEQIETINSQLNILHNFYPKSITALEALEGLYFSASSSPELKEALYLMDYFLSNTVNFIATHFKEIVIPESLQHLVEVGNVRS